MCVSPCLITLQIYEFYFEYANLRIEKQQGFFKITNLEGKKDFLSAKKWCMVTTFLSYGSKKVGDSYFFIAITYNTIMKR